MGCACGKEVLEINGQKYIVRDRLGEGGFSCVDLIEGIYSHKLYALKRILASTQEDERKAMQEIQYYQQIKHRSVIKCIEWTTNSLHDGDDHEICIVLPFYKRGTLQEEINNRCLRRDHFSESEVLCMFKEICGAIESLHKCTTDPVAHRDLKPGNILLTDDFSPILMDFGSAGNARHEIKSTAEAKAFEDMAAQYCSMLYRPPEFFHLDRDSVLDERTDIWSLGCLLYGICFFKSPFEAAYECGGSIALAVIGGNIDIPKHSPYSSELHQLILSMLQVEGKDRPFIHDILANVSLLFERHTDKC